MALPSDVQLVAVTCGSGSTFFGEDATVTVEVAPVLGGNLKHLVHNTTGSFMTKSKQIFTGEPGQPATFTVPNSSQPETWIDGTGAFFTGWAYLATIIVRAPNGETERWTKSFTPALGQTTIDLDLVPDGQIGGGVSAPVPPVTSVNGQTGAVVVEGGAEVTPEAVAANLPERLSETALTNASVQTSRMTVFHDTFADVANEARPTVADSGQQWAYLNGGNAVVQNGYLDVVPGGRSFYAEVNMGAPVSRIGAEFMFDDLGGTATEYGALALVTWTDGGVVANGLGRGSRAHIGLTTNNVEVRTRPPGNPAGNPDVPTELIGNYPLTEPLIPGEHYTFEVFIDGDTLVIYPPVGPPFTVTDPRFAASADQFVCWEPIYVKGAAAKRFRIRRVWADVAPANGHAATDMSPAVAREVTTLATRLNAMPPSPGVLAQNITARMTIPIEKAPVAIAPVTGTAGPTGRIIWDIDVPIEVSAAAGTPRIYYGMDETGTYTYLKAVPVPSTTFAGYSRLRMVETRQGGEAATLTRSLFVQDKNGTGKVVIPSLVDIIITATPA